MLSCLTLSAVQLVGCSQFRQPKPATDADREFADQLSRSLTPEPDKSEFEKALDWSKQKVGLGPNRSLAEQLYAESKSKYDAAIDAKGADRIDQFRDAARGLEKAAGRWPNSELEEKALFLAGESYFFGEEYTKAENAFGELVKKYPNTHHIDTVDARRFDIGRYWIETAKAEGALALAPNVTRKDRPIFDMFNHGVRVLDRIRLDDPTGRLADDATMAAGMAHFEKGNYARADELFTDLRHSFPSSDHQFNAHLYGLKAKMMIYQGAGYDGAPLEQVAELVQQINRMFPAESQQHQEFLMQVAKDVRLNQALRDYERAEYFDRRKQYGAARQYYARVRDKYSDTSLAEKSTDRLAKLGDAPNHPPQYLPWLVEMMPSAKNPKPLVARAPGTHPEAETQTR